MRASLQLPLRLLHKLEGDLSGMLRLRSSGQDWAGCGNAEAVPEHGNHSRHAVMGLMWEGAARRQRYG